MMFIHLHDLIFYAKHGLHEEEKLLGGEFIVNVSAGFHTNETVNNINDTVNYVAVYELVKEQMSTPSPLLETIASNISTQILAQFSIVEEVFISIKKSHPPIPSFEGSVGVSYSIKRENIK